MKKIILAVVATCAVVAFVPASALAQRHGKHHRHAHHTRVHHKKFGTDPTMTPPSMTPPNTSPATGAGTIQSFSGGVLMIKLNDGTTVSGQVTQDTEIKCLSQSPGMDSGSSGMDWQGHHEGDHGGGGGDQGGNGGGDQGGNNDQGDNDQDDQGDNDQDDQNQVCDMTSLTAGAVVLEAELNISSAGAVWEKVVIMSTPTSTAPSTSTSSSSGSDDD